MAVSKECVQKRRCHSKAKWNWRPLDYDGRVTKMLVTNGNASPTTVVERLLGKFVFGHMKSFAEKPSRTVKGALQSLHTRQVHANDEAILGLDIPANSMRLSHEKGQKSLVLHLLGQARFRRDSPNLRRFINDHPSGLSIFARPCLVRLGPGCTGWCQSAVYLTRIATINRIKIVIAIGDIPTT